MNETPWLVPSAIEWLDDYLKPTMRAFEWGAGGSTVWYAKRVASLVTVEHTIEYALQTVAAIADAGITNSEILHIKIQDSDAAEYVNAVANYLLFDFIAVDGRHRVGCIRAAIPRLMPGGVLLLDNSERAEYTDGIALMSGWERRDFVADWQTSVFVKPLEVQGD